MQPETKFARLGDSRIAYQVIGEWPRDLVYAHGVGSHVDVQWEEPSFVATLRRLASFSRLITFDRRGTGASDPVPLDGLPTWEDWADDLRAVLDAAGSERTAIWADNDGGPAAMLFAAAHPHRVSALILVNTTARYVRAPDYPHGYTPEVAEALLKAVEEFWGTEASVELLWPSMAGDERFRRWWAKYARAAARPLEVAAHLRNVLGIDVRAALPLIRAPTLVVHRSGFRLVSEEQARYLAERIPDARLVSAPGGDCAFLADRDREVLDVVEEFVTGMRHRAEPDRVFATVLFTDIVDSTDRAAALGDRRWRSVLDAHDEIAREWVERFDGRVIKHTGDGVLATFDGPGRAIRCSFALGDALREVGIEIRAGLHAGEVELRDAGDVGGIAVHIGSRVMTEAAPGEIVCSRTVKDLVAGSGFVFEDRGVHPLKGVPEDWQVFAIHQPQDALEVRRSPRVG